MVFYFEVSSTNLTRAYMSLKTKSFILLSFGMVVTPSASVILEVSTRYKHDKNRFLWSSSSTCWRKDLTLLITSSISRGLLVINLEAYSPNNILFIPNIMYSSQ